MNNCYNNYTTDASHNFELSGNLTSTESLGMMIEMRTSDATDHIVVTLDLDSGRYAAKFDKRALRNLILRMTHEVY